MVKREVSIVAFVAFAALGCATAAGPTASPVATAPTPSLTLASPTSSPAPAAATADIPSSSCDSTTAALRMGILPAGRYHTNLFDPQLELTLLGGWSEFFPDEDDGIYMGARHVEMLIARPKQIIDPETGDAADTPDDLVAWLTSHPRLNAGAPMPVEVAGVLSTYVDLSPTSDVDVLYGGGRGNNFHLPGINVRFYVIPHEGADLLVAVLPTPGGTLEAALAPAIPVIESLEIIEAP